MHRFYSVRRLVIMPLCAAALASYSQVHAHTYVLAVGINDYVYEQQLSGAEPDAVDVAETLRRLGADVTLLRNKEATPTQIEQTWRGIVERAKAGDTVVLSYAGHGGQEPDKAPLDEEDGLDESFLLSGFNPDPRHKGFKDRLLDDTIHDWLAQADAKGVKVIFVADSCHSGTMTRGDPDPRAVVSVRARPPYGLPETTSLEDLKQAGGQLPASATSRDDYLRHVTFLSATQEGRKAPEVVIDGKRRGALSYAFARALEGGADSNGDGTLSRFELETYIGRQVRQISEAQQAADLKPRGGDDVDLLSLPARLTSATHPPTATLKLAVLGMSSSDADALRSKLTGASLAATREAADLIWDAEKEDVISSIGDPVAHKITRTSLQGVIDKWLALPALKVLVAARPLDVHLDPDDGRHPAGSTVAIYTAPLDHPFVTIVDIAPDGTLRLLYPLPNDPPRWPSGQPYREDRIEVQEPLGADHVVFVASDKPLSRLHANLRTLSVADLPRLLEQELKDSDYRLGLLALYTAPARKEP